MTLSKISVRRREVLNGLDSLMLRLEILGVLQVMGPPAFDTTSEIC